MSIAGGIVSILDWLKDKLPIASRLEKIKNDIAKLEKERKEILGGGADVKKSQRLSWIDSHLDELKLRLQNATGNS